MGQARKSLRGTGSFSEHIQRLESRLLLSAIRYVDVNSPGPAHDGTTWDSAYLDPQQALGTAVAGDQIRVADGTYRPTTGSNPFISFSLKNGVSLLGGYAGSGAADPDDRNVATHVTVLSGDIGVIGATIDNTTVVVSASNTNATAVLDGFTVTAAYESAMSNSSSSPTVSNCTFSGNGKYSDGAGMCNRSSSPTVSNCIFSANSTLSRGAGMYNASSSPTVSNCSFVGNSAGSGYGGGMYNGSSLPKVNNCTFSGNSASRGGGMYNEISAPTVSNCTFSGNSTDYGDGGGMYNYSAYNPSSLPKVNNCTFSGNSAAKGGGMYNYTGASTVSNCAFTGNTAGSDGGGMYNDSGAPTINNCTFSGNSAGRYAGGMYNSSSSAKVRNCILWANTALSSSQIYQSGGTTAITFNDIEGGWTGTGNIDSDPLLMRNPSPGPDTVWGTSDDDYGDLRLQASSPCIDAASNAAVPAGITTDLAGNPRFVDVPGAHDPGAIVDMGAYEYTVTLAASGGSFLFAAAKPAVKIAFNANLDSTSLLAGDLVVQNLTTGQFLDCGTSSTASFDLATCSATWAFASPLTDGNYRATLPAASVSDAAGNPLASDFTFDFFAFAGDANHDRTVDISDLGILATNWQGSGKTFAQGDFNYDGIVDISDLGILATSWQKTLPAPSQPASPGPRSVVPSRSPIRSPFGSPQAAADSARRSLVEEVGMT